MRIALACKLLKHPFPIGLTATQFCATDRCPECALSPTAPAANKDVPIPAPDEHIFIAGLYHIDCNTLSATTRLIAYPPGGPSTRFVPL